MINLKLIRYLFLCVLISGVLSGCATKIGQPVKDPQIHSLLILPVKNESGNDQVDLIFPAVLHYVFAERGYYVYSPRLVSTVLDKHGLLESGKFRQEKPADIADLFGADAILYLNVKAYNISTVVLSTCRRVGLTYEVYDKTGKLIHQDAHYVKLNLDPNSASYNPITSVYEGVAAALELDGPINAMQAVTAISHDFAPGPFHDDSISFTMRAPFQDKVILEPHPRNEDETRYTSDRDPDNI